jgi:hypothetical protein
MRDAAGCPDDLLAAAVAQLPVNWGWNYASIGEA